VRNTACSRDNRADFRALPREHAPGCPTTTAVTRKMPSEISYRASMENVSRGGMNRSANAALGFLPAGMRDRRKH
jgi:hypothetical protein